MDVFQIVDKVGFVDERGVHLLNETEIVLNNHNRINYTKVEVDAFCNYNLDENNAALIKIDNALYKLKAFRDSSYDCIVITNYTSDNEEDIINIVNKTFKIMDNFSKKCYVMFYIKKHEMKYLNDHLAFLECENYKVYDNSCMLLMYNHKN